MTAGGALTVTLAAAYASLAPGAPTIAVAFVGVAVGTLLIGAMAAAGGGGIPADPGRDGRRARALGGLRRGPAGARDRDERALPVGRRQPAADGLGPGQGRGADRHPGGAGDPRPRASARRGRPGGRHRARPRVAIARDAGRRRGAGRGPDRRRRRPLRPDRVHRRAGLRHRALREAARPRGHARRRDPVGRRDPARRRRRGPRDHGPGHRDPRGRRLRADRRAGPRHRGEKAARRGRARGRSGRERRALAAEGHGRGAGAAADRDRRQPLPGGDRDRTAEVVKSLFGTGSPLGEIALESRAPRLAVALLGGACLAASGTVLQAAVRNPFAGPELAGVVGGASVGAFTVLLVFPDAPTIALPFAAFGGALAGDGDRARARGRRLALALCAHRPGHHRGLRGADRADAPALPARSGDRDHVALGLHLRDELERLPPARGAGGDPDARRPARRQTARRPDARRRARDRARAQRQPHAGRTAGRGRGAGRRRGRRLRRDRLRRPARAARRAAARGRQPPPRAADGDRASARCCSAWPIPSGAPCSPRPRFPPASSCP